MRYVLLTIVGVLVLGGSVFMGGARADGASPVPSPSASPSVSPSPTVIPSTAKLRRFCLNSRARAIKAYKKYARARACFDQRPLVRVARRPLVTASAQVWINKRNVWIKQRAQLDRLFKRLRTRMIHPGGSSNGVRWKPLARWVGWPKSTLPNLTYIIMRESSGRQNALNPSSNCAGLLQLHPGWYRGWWGMKAGNPFNPEYNLRTGYLIWRKCGWSPWAL